MYLFVYIFVIIFNLFARSQSADGHTYEHACKHAGRKRFNTRSDVDIYIYIYAHMSVKGREPITICLVHVCEFSNIDILYMFHALFFYLYMYVFFFDLFTCVVSYVLIYACIDVYKQHFHIYTCLSQLSPVSWSSFDSCIW